jgi:hypothetical protein
MVLDGGRRFDVGVGGVSGLVGGRRKAIGVFFDCREYVVELYYGHFGLMVGGKIWSLEMRVVGCSFEGQTILGGPGASVSNSS